MNPDIAVHFVDKDRCNSTLFRAPRLFTFRDVFIHRAIKGVDQPK